MPHAEDIYRKRVVRRTVGRERREHAFTLGRAPTEYEDRVVSFWQNLPISGLLAELGDLSSAGASPANSRICIPVFADRRCKYIPGRPLHVVGLNCDLAFFGGAGSDAALVGLAG